MPETSPQPESSGIDAGATDATIAASSAQETAEPGPSPQEQSAVPSTSSNEDDGEEQECGWCKWMKGGGCQEQFQVWLDCVDDIKAQGREDVETCASVMGPLWECMERNKEYYAPQLEGLKERRASDSGAVNSQGYVDAAAGDPNAGPDKPT